MEFKDFSRLYEHCKRFLKKLIQIYTCTCNKNCLNDSLPTIPSGIRWITIRLIIRLITIMGLRSYGCHVSSGLCRPAIIQGVMVVHVTICHSIHTTYAIHSIHCFILNS